MARVSVIIPNYNREKLIGETLESLLAQTRPADEIIIVDDGSSDGSIDVIRSFEPHVRLICQENSGPAVARNRGLAESTGDFISFFDSDDLCTADKIERQLGALEQTGGDVAYSPWLHSVFRGDTIEYSEDPLQQKPLPDDHPITHWFLRGWVTVFQNMLIRRSLLTAVGPYRADLKPTEDSELLFRMMLANARFVHVPQTLMIYRIHPDNQISGSALPTESRARDWQRYYAAILDHMAANRDRFTRWDFLAVRANAARNDRILRRLGAAGDSDFLTGRLEALALSIPRRIREVSLGLERRRTGYSFSRPYGQAPLTADQTAMIRKLGYEPVRS